MCILRSSNGSGCKFSIDVVVSYLGDKRNGVFTMCVHRSCNCSSCRFSIEVEVNYPCSKRKGM